MQISEQRAKNDAEGNKSIAELLPSRQVEKNIMKEQQQGKQTVVEENKLPLQPGQK
jgi:hypothetical protein